MGRVRRRGLVERSVPEAGRHALLRGVTTGGG